METYETDGAGCDESLIESYDENATPTVVTTTGDMVMTSEIAETGNDELDRYIKTISGEIVFNGVPKTATLGGQTQSLPARPKRSKQGTTAPEELLHASEMSLSLDSDVQTKTERFSRSSSTSSTRVEIQDLGEESINFTTSTLRKCKQLVLKPYWGLLVFIGWRAFKKDTLQSQRKDWYILNIIYTATIILLLFYSYGYEILACEWKLDLTKDTHLPTTKRPSTTHSTQNSSMAGLTYGMATHFEGNESTLRPSHNPGCDHIVTSYLIPNVLHLIAYLMGLYYFRIQENEQLYALMEKVFLQATPLQARTTSQHKMIVRLRFFLAIGSVWVFAAALLQCLCAWALDFPKMSIFRKTGTTGYWIMFAIELLGRTVFNSVILAIVMNFSTQCEMIKFYVRGLTMRLQEKSTDLKTAMKDILLLRHSLGILNGVISRMTSLVAFILAELTIIGVCILFVNEIDIPKVWLYRGLFPLVWAPMFIFPLFQGARVNSICLRIQKYAIEMRVFGYKGASILDLDSFLHFTTITKLKAKILHIPILPSHLIFILVAGAFILLILLQTSSIGPARFIF